MNTLCVDFDGVIYPNLYYRGAAYVSGDPVEGVVEALAELSKEYRIVIHSARCANPKGMAAIQVWLELQGMPYEVVRDKPHAVAYIDDRAIRFSGDWRSTIAEVRTARQWQVGPKACARKARRHARRGGRR